MVSKPALVDRSGLDVLGVQDDQARDVLHAVDHRHQQPAVVLVHPVGVRREDRLVWQVTIG